MKPNNFDHAGAVDDKLDEFLDYPNSEGVSDKRCADHYLAARSYFVWNRFTEKLRAVPQEIKKTVVTDAYYPSKIEDM